VLLKSHPKLGMPQHCNIMYKTLHTNSVLLKVFSSSCAPFEIQSTKCTNYSFNGVHNFPDQSSQITTILMNVTSIVNGSFCRDRVLEFLCNYLLPPCENNLPVPICSESCDEYLTTGICVEDLQNVLRLLMTEGYLNTTVDELIAVDCSLPQYANSCNNLTGK